MLQFIKKTGWSRMLFTQTLCVWCVVCVWERGGGGVTFIDLILNIINREDENVKMYVVLKKLHI